MKWRFLPLETMDAFTAMARDEALIQSVSTGGPPTIRFWRWKPSAVSIGRFQSMDDEINLEKCKELGVDYIRRVTGGGAVYHDYDGEITYSIIAPEGLVSKGITESYKEICGWIINGLKAIEISSEFKPINDIITNGKKISGNAQTRRQSVVLQHGTILYDLDVRKMFSLLKVGADKISDKMIQAVEERVTCIKKQKDISYEETYEAIKNAFLEGKDFEESSWTEEELQNSEELKKKYKSEEWNFNR